MPPLAGLRNLGLEQGLTEAGLLPLNKVRFYWDTPLGISLSIVYDC